MTAPYTVTIDVYRHDPEGPYRGGPGPYERTIEADSAQAAVLATCKELINAAKETR